MRVIGIDPGTATMGYAIVEEDAAGEAHLVACGAFLTPAADPMARRLLTLYRDLQGLVGQAAAEALAVEELFFSRNVSTALTVGQARGVVLLAAAEAGIEVFEYKPAEVKQALVGYGRADKRQIQEMLRLMLGLESAPKPDDAADAAAVAICHLHSARLRRLAGA
jgi:crossover junction endodeoxyribonuclease RuvC